MCGITLMRMAFPSVLGRGLMVLAALAGSRFLSAAEPPLLEEPAFGRVSIKPHDLAAIVAANTAQAEAALGRALAAVEHAIVAADVVEVFEGLPREHEKELLAVERKKPLQKWDDQEFYATPQPVSAEQRHELASLLRAGTLATHRWGKLCGGFHADYAVRWSWNDGQNTTIALFCLGCHDARVLAGGRQTTDITSSGGAALKKFFAAFQRERPKSLPIVARPIPPASVKP